MTTDRGRWGGRARFDPPPSPGAQHQGASIDALLDQFVGQTRIANRKFSFTREQSFTVIEDTSTSYGQVILGTTMFGVFMRDNLGLPSSTRTRARAP
jgi:hypothetical protein